MKTFAEQRLRSTEAGVDDQRCPDDTPNGPKPRPRLRHRVRVNGRVQGVGFRPFVARLATEMAVAGFVGNDAQGVFIEVEGTADALGAFTGRFLAEIPPLAHVASFNTEIIPTTGATSFVITESRPGGAVGVHITPDAATCDDCRRELFCSDDRRYAYPFINCTNCGPRYSIIESVPYDRPATTMASFAMCQACAAEYHDPCDRRYHAQPNACAACGPIYWYMDDTETRHADPIATCATALTQGRIVAIKGLGGFHLAALAADPAAIATLRARKGREAKALALMVADLTMARRLVSLSPDAEALLTSPAHPIVLAPVVQPWPEKEVCPDVAPGCDLLGVMLPYTPLHHLLMARLNAPLVMTSANKSEEPLCADNDEAQRRLAGVADAFLFHDRAIARPIDDSVVLSLPEHTPPWLMLRRARGYVPVPVQLPIPTPRPLLAVGGDLKSTFCLLRQDTAVVSEHLGDLANPDAFRNFDRAVGALERLLDVGIESVVCDLHPSYASAHYAHSRGLEVVTVQHHHAHLAACMAEHHLRGEVVGICCDGTGYGLDGQIWGGEILVGGAHHCHRHAHLQPFPLPGGDAAARQTWRPALGWLWESVGSGWRGAMAQSRGTPDWAALELLGARLLAGTPIIHTTSLGRLFDAVAFLLGVADFNRYEGEAAMCLELSAKRSGAVRALPFTLRPAGEQMIIGTQPMLEDLLFGMKNGVPSSDLAAAFHLGIAAALVEAADHAAEHHGLHRVVLSGGCFANGILTQAVTQGLRARRRQVFSHQHFPCGDGGLSLGQAYIGAARHY